MVNPDGSGLETLNHIGRHELARLLQPRLQQRPQSRRVHLRRLRLRASTPRDPQHARDPRERRSSRASTSASTRPSSAPTPPAGCSVIHGAPDRTRRRDGDHLSHHPRHRERHRRRPGRLPLGPLPQSAAALRDGSGSSPSTPARRAPACPRPGRPRTTVDGRPVRATSSGCGSWWRRAACAGYLAVRRRRSRRGSPRRSAYWDPDVLVTLHQRHDVGARPGRGAAADARPPAGASRCRTPEAAVFSDEGVDVAAFRDLPRERDLALIVSRDVTTRDRADRQQPFNLRVPGGSVQTIPAPAAASTTSTHMQLFQADLIRGASAGSATPACPGGGCSRSACTTRRRSTRRSPGRPGRSRRARRRRLDGGARAGAPGPHLAADRRRRDAGGARALLADLPAGRDPRLRVLPRAQQTRPGARRAPRRRIRPRRCGSCCSGGKGWIFVAHFEDGDTAEWSSSAP